VGECLNLWRGFGVTAAPGDWSLLRKHILEVMAGGNQEYHAYIIRWMAWAVQNPDKPAGVTPVFKGGEGTGKETLARAMVKLFGLHGLQILSQQHFTGKFNAQLHQCCLLFADEAFYAGDKKSEGVLKGLITEPTFLVERKTIDPVRVLNRLHVIMASNKEWVVPAAQDARRFAVFEVAEERAGDTKWFDLIYSSWRRTAATRRCYTIYRPWSYITARATTFHRPRRSNFRSSCPTRGWNGGL